MRKFKSRLGKLLKRCFRRSSNDGEAASTIPVPPDIVEPENCVAEGLRKDVSFEETRGAAPETVRAEDVAKIATAIDTGSTALTSLSSAHRNVAIWATAIEPTGEDVESAYELWKPVLENVESFASLIEAIGDLHPYAKIASKVLLSVVKPVIDQDKRDNAMADLLGAMNELYGLVNKTGRLSDLDKYRKGLLKDMSSKTEECAKFIQDEARFTNFWIRTGSNVITGSRVDEKVREFTEAFVDLRRSFTEAGVLETEILVANLADSSKIDNLTHVRGAGLDSGRACLEGTRVKTLGALRDWINNPKPDAPRVLFLLGGAGTGKSSIAHSIGVHLEARRRLGAFFSFNRTFQAERPPKYVFSTIAHDLANWDPTFRHALADVLHDHGALVGSVDIAKQWKRLIAEPLKKVGLVGPVVVVIDAFDESSSASTPERRLLLKLLTEGSSELPSNFRILITSRPEHDVMRVVGRSEDGHRHINHISLDDNKEEATSDIERYLRHELASDDTLSEEALDDADFRLLVTKAEGLFQWAATACRVVLESPAGLTLQERLNLRLGAVLGGGAFSLDDLYRSILEQHFQLDEPVLSERFRSVMAQILCASSPLSMDSLDELRRLATGGKRDEVTLVVQYMGPLLSGVSSRTSPIRPLHTSFRDFLTDKARSREWFVDLSAGHSTMALGCFRIMNERLSFNICHLDTSYVLNREIPDLESRLITFVSQSLSYASCSWKDHLAATHPPDLQQDVIRFLREKLLFWFELLSLLKCVNRAAPSLEALKGYENTASDSLRELLRDAISFIRRFAGVIAQAAPHVYISALPFSPTLSKVRTNYLPHFPSLPHVDGIRDRWPQDQAVLSRHTNIVGSVAYSLDGRYIVSGSADGTVRVWDAETGEVIHELSCDDWVCGVAFSPDGRHIAAALNDWTVRIWDSTTGEAVCEPLQGHKWGVLCVAYSPDGRRIVSGDGFGHICIRSVDTLGIINQLFCGDSGVACIAFSPSSGHIASGLDDRTVRVWDAVEGKAVGKPFKGHTSRVNSVLFSLDGLQIVSGSSDSTIRIWDFGTQQTIRTISHPLLDGVLSLSLSPDGKRIVSGCGNGGILIWDLETYGIGGGPLVGHSSTVCAVSFSPDGRHIVSGSSDATIRIWSAEEGASVESTRDASFSYPSKYKPARILDLRFGPLLAYSPDGRRIVSGSDDGVIEMWDADTGNSIGVALKGQSSKDIVCVRFSPDGRRLIVVSASKTPRVWDSTTLQPLGKRLRGHRDWVRDAHYSPDGRRIVSCSGDRTIRIWDAETYECLVGPLCGHENKVDSVAWSPDGTRIASGSWDGTVRVWDAETGQAVGEPFRGREGWIRCVSWSMDGRYLMSSTDGGTIRFWDLETWGPSGNPIYTSMSRAFTAMFWPRYRRVVSPDMVNLGTIWMWDTETREPVGENLSNPFGSIHSLALSPDGRHIVSRSNTIIVVWDANAFTDPCGPHPPFVNYNTMSRTSFDGSFQSSTPPEYPYWNGWITDKNGNHVMWVPDEYRDCLLWRGMVKVMGRESITIKFPNAFSGTEWAKCYRPHYRPQTSA